MSGESKPASVRDIANLLAWARRLSEAGPAAEPREKAAYLAAKADLLARIQATRIEENS